MQNRTTRIQWHIHLPLPDVRVPFAAPQTRSNKTCAGPAGQTGVPIFGRSAVMMAAAHGAAGNGAPARQVGGASARLRPSPEAKERKLTPRWSGRQSRRSKGRQKRWHPLLGADLARAPRPTKLASESVLRHGHRSTPYPSARGVALDT